MTTHDRMTCDLTPAERHLLWLGLREWGGPARCTEQLARGMGHDGLDEFVSFRSLIAQSIQDGEALTRHDWRRALLATEFVFASDVVGSGVDWPTTTGLSDVETITLLRTLQRKLIHVT